MRIREIIAEQRRLLSSGNRAERFAAALLIPGVLAKRLRLLDDRQIAQLLEEEVCANMGFVAPELTICTEAADRLRRPRRFALRSRPRKISQHEGEHLLHAEAALYRARIPHLLLPFQKNKFASNVYLVPCLPEAEDCLFREGFRKTLRSPSLLVDGETGRPIRVVEHRT